MRTPGTAAPTPCPLVQHSCEVGVEVAGAHAVCHEDSAGLRRLPVSEPDPEQHGLSLLLCLLTSLPADPRARLPACLPTGSGACLPARSPACLTACLPDCPSGSQGVRQSGSRAWCLGTSRSSRRTVRRTRTRRGRTRTQAGIRQGRAGHGDRRWAAVHPSTEIDPFKL
jgi:hypothetical protein